ncbi:MAG: DUF4382 domain-containing protein, partial [Dehalococcoidia bacterium]
MKRVLSIAIGVTLIMALGITSIGCVSEPTTGPEPEAPAGPAPAGPAAPNTGTVKLLVTDAPPGENVTSIEVTIAEEGVEIHRAVAEQEQTGGGDQTQTQQQVQQGEGEWITIDIAEDDRTFDLLEIEGIEEFLGEGEVEAGKYTQLRLTIEKIEVTLGAGKPQEANLPSGVLKFVRPFDVVGGETVEILIDFDADRSVNVTGAGKIQVKPVVKLEIKTGKQAGQTAEGEEVDEEEPEEVEFEGTIETIDGDIWTMTVDDETMRVDVSEAEIDGEPDEGLEAEVEGVMDGETVIASEV